MVVLADPYNGSVHTGTPAGDHMHVEISEVGDGIWQLAIPNGTPIEQVTEAVSGTVFEGIGTDFPRLAVEDVDGYTLVYVWEEPEHE